MCPNRDCKRLVLIVALAAVSWAGELHAQVVKVQSSTLGRYQQRLRLDNRVDAVRALSQRVSVWVWDARGNQSQDLNIVLDARYFTDFGLGTALRLDPLFGTEWNDLVLERMMVEWRPVPWTRLGLGRQWGVNALGMQEFDGISVRLAPSLGKGVRARLELEGGRDVQLETGWYTSDSYDVQGLPSESRDVQLSDWATTLGGTVGLGWSDAGVAVSYRRRDYEEEGAWATGEDRIGAAIHGQISRHVNISAQGVYNNLLEDVERASLQVASRTWQTGPLVSLGIDQQTPWFDSRSIFNVFGPSAHRGGWLTLVQNVPHIDTEFELRGWGRIYDVNVRDEDGNPFQFEPVHVGGALAHRTRVPMPALPLEWRSTLSFQQSVDATYQSEQWLADSTVRVPVTQTLTVVGRGVVLHSQSDYQRAAGQWGTTGVLGLEWDTELGEIAFTVEGQHSEFLGGNLQGYVSWDVEVWR